MKPKNKGEINDDNMEEHNDNNNNNGSESGDFEIGLDETGSDDEAAATGEKSITETTTADTTDEGESLSNEITEATTELKDSDVCEDEVSHQQQMNNAKNSVQHDNGMDKETRAEPNNTEEASSNTPITSDEDSAPGYLYLNRQRANTTGALTTITASTSQSTLPESHSTHSMPSSFTTQLPFTPEVSSGRTIPNQCAICLCDYEKGDTVVVSCNKLCPHAFHQECIVEWLAKMQEGTPCPCCRRTFVELDEYLPGNKNTNVATGTNVITSSQQSPEEAERLRQIRRRRHIELGLQRGRAFNASVISMW